MHLHACIDRTPPPEKLIEAAELSVKENPANVPIVVVHPGMGVAPPDAPGARRHHRQEVAERQEAARALPRRHAVRPAARRGPRQALERLREHHRRVRQRPRRRDPDLVRAGGLLVVLGTTALVIDQTEPTMNFGWLEGRHPTRSTSASSCTSSATRSFCIHEHQNPGHDDPVGQGRGLRLLHGPAEQLDEGPGRPKPVRPLRDGHHAVLRVRPEVDHALPDPERADDRGLRGRLQHDPVRHGQVLHRHRVPEGRARRGRGRGGRACSGRVYRRARRRGPLPLHGHFRRASTWSRRTGRPTWSWPCSARTIRPCSSRKTTTRGEGRTRRSRPPSSPARTTCACGTSSRPESARTASRSSRADAWRLDGRALRKLRARRWREIAMRARQHR